jgi:hypothetical protein
MKAKLRVLVALSVVLAPFSVFLPGCNQPDTPKMETAPPPPAPKPEELKVPKAAGGKAAYGANEKYQKAMERMGKRLGGQQ